MEINLYLLLSLLIALLVISYLLGKLHRVRGQLFLIRDVLNDIKAGNLNRRVLVRESDLTKQICYDINEIAMSSQSRLIQQKQSEQAYKRLMTSLSHDVKTPLASLVGYLEAVESKMVTEIEIKREIEKVRPETGHPSHTYGRYQNVFLTDEELADLQVSFPAVWEQYIEKLSEYMASTGKRYQSHAATIRRWAGEDAKKTVTPSRNRDYSVKEDETV